MSTRWLAALFLLGWLALGAAPARAACDAPPAFLALVRDAMDAKRSVTFLVEGQSVAVLVTGLVDECTVEGRNREHDRVLIRLDRVAALARS